MSLTTYAKTGSKRMTDNLEKLGSHTETIYILDKWAEWLSVQSLLIPGNIKNRHNSTTSFLQHWLAQ